MITFQIMEFSSGDGWVLIVDTGQTLVRRICAAPYFLSLRHAYDKRRQVAAIETRSGVCGEGGLLPPPPPPQHPPPG